MRRAVFLFLLLVPILSAAENRAGVVLLGKTDHVPFDEVKAIYFANTVEALLKSCTTATKEDSIPAVAYKGVRITQPDGNVIEAHIFPDSRDNYMVKVYTKADGIIQLHGKYTDHAYQLISMLEMSR